MKCLAKVSVLPQGYILNGEKHLTENQGKLALTEIYRGLQTDYPKFFKMDTLSRLGWVSSELLLQYETIQTGMPRFEPIESRAVVLANVQSSLCNDRHYQATIQEKENFFPSPALFVYTLPNIVTGEIAIRNKYFGETSFYVLDHFDAGTLAQLVATSFLDSSTHSVLAGWVDAEQDEVFEAHMALLTQEEADTLAEQKILIEKTFIDLHTYGKIN